MSRQVQSPKRRHGMTLTELLVVVMIITLMIGALLPLMKSGNDDRKLREWLARLGQQLRRANNCEGSTPSR